MKFFIFFIILLVSGCLNDSEQLSDCSLLKKGKFTIINDSPRIKSEITRKDSIQVVKNLITGSIDTEKIAWIDECSYTVKDINKGQNLTLKIEVIKISNDTFYLRGSYPSIEYKP